MAIIPIDNLIPNRNRTASIPICESFCTEIPENTDQLVISLEKTDSFY